ncbi:hypothetical protein [Salinigranum salinum]|uniref:hypothetical protein n=1 Tax=Salinigranum salinum TaxID=1364937 RepID=UPI0012603EC9|nr:hypothetical protein [Salinigranum salinum]
MAPTTSDASRDDDRRSSPDDEFSIGRETIQGREALVHRHPDRLYVEWRAGQPVYYGVSVGDRLKDADSDVSSPRITEWTVTEITPDRIVGEAIKTGDRREFDRERVERGLVVGNYATNLSDFARVAVHAVGDWDAYDPDTTDGTVYRGRPYVTVVAYGNNGRKYGLRYRYVTDGDDETLTLWEEDVVVGALDAEPRRRLFDAVEATLAAEGYTTE